jgi:hypothetical protein
VGGGSLRQALVLPLIALANRTSLTNAGPAEPVFCSSNLRVRDRSGSRYQGLGMNFELLMISSVECRDELWCCRSYGEFWWGGRGVTSSGLWPDRFSKKQGSVSGRTRFGSAFKVFLASAGLGPMAGHAGVLTFCSWPSLSCSSLEQAISSDQTASSGVLRRLRDSASFEHRG